MSTATAPLTAGFTLTGSTMGRETAPIYYTINGSGFGAAIGQQFTLAELTNTRVQYIPEDDRVELYVNGFLLGRFVPGDDQISSIIAALPVAASSISNSINQQATSVPTSASNASNVTGPNVPNQQPPVVNTTVTPAPSLNTISRAPVITTDSVAGAADLSNISNSSISVPPAAGAPPAADPITGDINFNPSSITVDSVNNAGGLDSIENSAAKSVTDPSQITLAKGEDILDIYNPNLTPEQIASLSYADQKARADLLGYEYTGPPVTIGEVDSATGQVTVKGITADKVATQSAATLQDQVDWKARQDWRVRLALSPESNYLYKASPPGILAPLKETDGVIFPYTPAINVTYAANYEAGTITHTNYKFFQYTSSSVDQVTITCDFTAQDTFEANYVLSVIHFFRSMTKMFYGQDSLPKNGTPPPLCYMFGMGGYQFAAHPLVINSFTYNLPSDVDYIKTTVAVDQPGVAVTPPANNSANAAPRLDASAIAPGGKSPAPQFNAPATNIETTWVPTKIQMVIGCYPIVSRNKISNVFSLKDYSSGKIFNGINNTRGGIW